MKRSAPHKTDDTPADHKTCGSVRRCDQVCQIMQNNILTEVDVMTFKVKFIFKILDSVNTLFCYPINNQHSKNSSVWIWTLSITRPSHSWLVAVQSSVLLSSPHFLNNSHTCWQILWPQNHTYKLNYVYYHIHCIVKFWKQANLKLMDMKQLLYTRKQNFEKM